MAKMSVKSTKAKPAAEAKATSPASATKSSKPAKNPKLPGFFKLFVQSLQLLRRHWKVFAGITLLFGILNVVLVQGLGATGGLGEAKATLDQLFTGSWQRLTSGVGLFVYLLGASGNASSPTAGVYQIILILIFSLAIIWTLRQVYAGHAVGVRDGLYKGLTPLIPCILVLLVIGLQLLPLALGATVYGIVTANSLVVTGVEQFFAASLFFMLAAVSLYFLSSSLFALYIVTLPDMTPLAALRSARELIRHRRFMVLRRVILLPIVLVVLSAVLIVPLILFATPLAAWAFFAVSMLLLPIAHSYMYALYRSLL